MDYTSLNKGDLVLVSDGNQTSTCIVLSERINLSTKKNDTFYYSYCLESGHFGLIYTHEIISLVSEGFAPDFDFESELFDADYSLYRELCETYSYFPYFIDPEEDSSGEE